MTAPAIARIGVATFIFRDGAFLIGKRKAEHGSDTWSVPGGHLEFGESFEETARREVREETGLEIANVRFGAVTNDLFPDTQKHYVTIWMLSDWVEGEPVITEPDKYIEQTWVTFEDLPTPLFSPWNQLLASEFIATIRAAAESTKR